MRLIVVLSAVCISLLLTTQGQAASTTVNMPAEVAPQVLEFLGTAADTNVDHIDATRYPHFAVTAGSEWAACKATILALSGQSGRTTMAYKNLITTPKINIDPRFRNTGKILVTWNVRIEGYDPPVVPISPGLCTYFVGTVQQNFKGGNARTRIQISTNGSTWTNIGNPISMTIPDGGIKTVEVNHPIPPPPRDPTHTGSYLITGADFSSGQLPDKIYLRLQWENDTALKLFSHYKMRSLVVTITRD